MKPMLISILALVITLFSSCTTEETIEVQIEPAITDSELYFPPVNSEIWETVSIEELNWNTLAQQPLFDLLERTGTKSFIILKNGKIAIEAYFNDATATDNNPWNSVGKTLLAFTMGVAQEEGFLDINNSSSIYLGNWSNLTPEQESNISIRHHLTMTTGLDYTGINLNCTDSDCLNFLNDSGSFWYYHNASYTLTQNIIESATNTNFTAYFNSKLKDRIGMQGAWISIGFNNIYFSNARSMARFGLLNLNNGIWEGTPILNDINYFNEMTNTSQGLNESYGYLWWLNGKASFRIPGSTQQLSSELIPNAPDDLIAGLGKNDQKLYIVPSLNLVVIRMGDNAGETLLGPSSFDNNLWEKISALVN